MPDFRDIAERYITAWNETDPPNRSRLLKDLWADDARYIDPLVVAEGREAIDATIGAVHG
jgi:hypothetical protein